MKVSQGCAPSGGPGEDRASPPPAAPPPGVSSAPPSRSSCVRRDARSASLIRTLVIVLESHLGDAGQAPPAEIL